MEDLPAPIIIKPQSLKIKNKIQKFKQKIPLYQEIHDGDQDQIVDKPIPEQQDDADLINVDLGIGAHFKPDVI